MKTNLKFWIAAMATILGVIVPHQGSLYAQEDSDVTPVRTREIKKGRTITVSDNEFWITLTTEKQPGETIALSLEALKGYEEGIWIDLNNNNIKDEGEAVTRFGKERIPYIIDAQTVTIYGKITALDCAGNNLTGLTTSGFAYLETLDCSSNLITELNVRRLNLLQKLDCSGNTIRDKQMTALLKSLPKRNHKDSGELIIGKLQGDTGKKIATQKNWDVIAD